MKKTSTTTSRTSVSFVLNPRQSICTANHDCGDDDGDVDGGGGDGRCGGDDDEEDYDDEDDNGDDESSGPTSTAVCSSPLDRGCAQR